MSYNKIIPGGKIAYRPSGMQQEKLEHLELI
jgi:hypothetical protein